MGFLLPLRDMNCGVGPIAYKMTDEVSLCRGKRLSQENEMVTYAQWAPPVDRLQENNRDVRCDGKERNEVTCVKIRTAPETASELHSH